MESLIISWTENVTAWSEERACVEKPLLQESAKENHHSPKSGGETTDFLLEPTQKLRKSLKQLSPASSRGGFGTSPLLLPPGPWLAVLLLLLGLCLGQVLPEPSLRRWEAGEMGESRPCARSSGELATPTGHPTAWESGTRSQEGQGRPSSQALFTCAKCQYVTSFHPHH